MTQDMPEHSGLKQTIAALFTSSNDYDYAATRDSNVLAQASTLDFEFENFLVCGVVWFIAVLLVVLVVALVVLVCVNTGNRSTVSDQDYDVEKQLETIQEESESDEENSDSAA